MEFNYTSIIMAAAISGAISIGILFLREKKIEPDRWRKNSQKEIIEKRLKAYSSIISFLDASKQRGENWSKSRMGEKTHLFIFPGDAEEFVKNFQDFSYLFSSTIMGQYMEIIEKDDRLMFSKKWEKKPSQWYETFDFSTLQQSLENEYNELKEKYEKMTGYELG